MDNPKVKVKRSKKFGRGVYATRTIRKGERIASFDGPFYGDRDHWTNDMYNHAIQFSPRRWRDSKGVARLINHSCDPNCGIRRLFDVVAMRTIRPGEQITWDYEMTEKNPDWRLKCKCGSPLCRRIIGDHRNMPPAIRKKYGTYVSAWLRKRPKRMHKV